MEKVCTACRAGLCRVRRLFGLRRVRGLSATTHNILLPSISCRPLLLDEITCYLLLVTCRMMSFLSIAFNVHILPVLVQRSLERAHCWRIHDMLGEAVPIVHHSLADEISS